MDTRTTRSDMHLADRLFARFLRRPETLPISYCIDGKTYHGMPAGTKTTTRFVDSRMVEMVYTACVSGVQIRTETLLYRDFPAAEWTIYLTYDGEGDSPLVSALNAAEMTFTGENARLITCNGDYCSPDGYANTETALTDGTVVTQAPVGGRCCDQAFPYQRLLFDGFGLNLSIGWPGQWTCRYEASGNTVSFTAGQETVHTVIRRGETFRSPRMSLVSFEGDLDRGINVWRRWYIAHVMPLAGGEPLRNYVNGSRNGGGIEFTAATEENQLEGIADYVKGGVPINCWWIDAGWYPSRLPDGSVDWWKTTGTWECDKERFPHGLAPLKKPLADADIDLLLWFEVERANAGTEMMEQHPEWLLRADGTSPVLQKSEEPEYGLMVNMGDEACVQWLSEKIANFLNENGIKVYRQDYNFEPLLYWRNNEAENRKGMLENKYIQGYLAYWDYLLWNVPDLTIDSCASGGRRNDLETMRRSVPFHLTDSSYGNHPIQQSFEQTLYTWIPYFRGFLSTWEDENGEYGNPAYYEQPDCGVDEFVLYHAIAPMMSISHIIEMCKDKPEELAQVNKAVQVFYDAVPTMTYGDFYALTPYHKSRFEWTVWQFDCPEKGTGIIRSVRNNAAAAETCLVHPKTITEGTWELENMRTGEKKTVCGAEIAEKGLTLAQPVRSAEFWKYHRIG